ncbi:uncharacterized protein CCOS01_15024 [Colletotrichum costaricense]|uniref:Fe2OG dioxygenase domain-containing protein n=1 Tax=Colletotrichum costaricense TaxID=1209916 RepID=A0AAI9YII2_9PEZI|nr:uncharacterized protein CCOS01_15024 [Colletotrichum costaricense]KAK1511262.1 hypothetical protein CCOS01_15024 [Colletotrichum costaricense]
MTAEFDCNIPSFTQCSPTKEDLDYVDLVNLDLSNFDDINHRQQLAASLLKGVTRHGFLSITNYGVPETLYSSQVDLAHALLTLPPEEKWPFETTPEQEKKELHIGFKPSGSQKHKQGFHKTLDHYDFPATTNSRDDEHPGLLHSHLAQVERLTNCFRQDLLPKLLALVAIVLEVPEGHLLSTHASATQPCSEYLRYLLYHPRPAESGAQYRDLWLGGHTDLGSFTFLFSQPVSSLQILPPSGDWKWVRYVPGALIVNVGEALELMTGGLFRATVHRVVKPPPDQERAKRLGIIYFARPKDDQQLHPLDSPLLRRLGIHEHFDEKIFTMSQYLHARKHGYKRLDFDHARSRLERLGARADGGSPHGEHALPSLHGLEVTI